MKPSRLQRSRRTEPVPELIVLSLDKAEAYEPVGVEICISITDPKAPPVQLSPRFADVLHLSFNDIAAPSQTPSDVLFDAEHAHEILTFLRRWPQAQRIVVHCMAGMSRSPGVALGICDLRGWTTELLEERYPSWNTRVRSELVRVGRASNRRRPRAKRHS
jgi:predicted protein tyrosine phosphatase